MPDRTKAGLIYGRRGAFSTPPANAGVRYAVRNGGGSSMDESTWRTGTEVQTMLMGIRGRVSPRKYRLFALACCRRREDLIRDWRCQEALRLGERLAEEKVPLGELSHARLQLEQARRHLSGLSGSPSVLGFDEALLAEA